MVTRSQFLQSVIALFVVPKVVAAKPIIKQHSFTEWNIAKPKSCHINVIASALPNDDTIYISTITPPILTKSYTLYRNWRTGEIIAVDRANYNSLSKVIRGWGHESGGISANYMLAGDTLYFIGYAHNG